MHSTVPKCSQVVQKWFQNMSKLVPKYKIGSKIGFKVGLKMVSKTGSKPFSNGLEWFKIG